MPLSSAGIREFLRDELGVDLTVLRDDTPLFSSGLLDSTMVTSLIAYAERELGARFAVADLGVANFDSIDEVLAVGRARISI